MRLSLSADARGSLIGTWSATFGNGESFSGAVVASLVQPNTYGITMYVDPPPSCGGPGLGGSALLGFSLINVVVTSDRLTAVAGRLSCSGPSFSTSPVNLSKQ